MSGELMFGAYNSQHVHDNVRRVRTFIGGLRAIVFDSALADHYGRIRALLQRSGSVIGGNDILIGAKSMAHSATLVTRNVTEFERIVGLDLVTW
jgi:tRNA(fMet)-specific endonuclease VapC